MSQQQDTPTTIQVDSDAEFAADMAELYAMATEIQVAA